MRWQGISSTKRPRRRFLRRRAAPSYGITATEPMATATRSTDDACMSNATITRQPRARSTYVLNQAARILEPALDRAATDATGQWLVLIGGDSQTSGTDEVREFLREMAPDVEADDHAAGVPRAPLPRR